jgi:hypothetical protein
MTAAQRKTCEKAARKVAPNPARMPGIKLTALLVGELFRLILAMFLASLDHTIVATSLSTRWRSI